MKHAATILAFAMLFSALAAEPGAENLPFVYTKWKQFTAKDGLPDDHIFAVKSDGGRIWVGTENGLALIDKKTSKVVKTWTEKDGLPFRAVTAIDIHPKTGDVWLGLFGGGLARFDGVRYGFRAEEARTLSEITLEDGVAGKLSHALRLTNGLTNAPLETLPRLATPMRTVPTSMPMRRPRPGSSSPGRSGSWSSRR